MTDNFRHAQYRADGSQIDDPQKLNDLASEQLLAGANFGASRNIPVIISEDQKELSAKIGAALTNKTLYLEGRTYTLTALLSAALTNAEIVGVPGQTKITGAFGNSVLRMLAWTNVDIYGVTFESTFASAIEDTGAGVIFSYQHSTRRVRFYRCKFTSPNSNSNGPSFYTRINSGDAGATIDGLLFDDCDFEDIGRVGCTVMNRFTGAGAANAAKDVVFTRNRFQSVGLAGTYGIALSLDGTGRNAVVEMNEFRNAGVASGSPVGIGIENTGWTFCDFLDNRFSDFRSGKLWAPMSFSVQGALRNTRNEVHRNKCVEPANSRCNFIGMDDSNFSYNYFEADSGDYAFAMRDSVRNNIRRDYYKSANQFAAIVGNNSTTTQHNKFVDVTFDNSSNGANAATVRFDGTNTNLNLIEGGNIRKGTGGAFIDSSNNTTRNAYEMRNVELDSIRYEGYRIINLTDADYTLQEVNAQTKALRFAGTLTATRVVTFPDVERVYQIVNTTTQTLTLSVSGGGTFACTAGMKVTIAYQRQSNGWYSYGTLT